MPSASETTTVVGTRTDGAVICRHKINRGRCNKFIATEKGEVRCQNGHLTPIADILVEALNRPDAPWEVLRQFWLHSSDIRPFIRRMASPEFLAADSDSRTSITFDMAPEILMRVLKYADHSEPECARTLRAYWEGTMQRISPEIAEHLRILKEKNDLTGYFRFRERALLAFSRRGTYDPLRELGWSEVLLEVAKANNHKHAVLYEHNINEATRFLLQNRRFPSPALVYFNSYSPHLEKQYDFSVIPDPHWSFAGWNSPMQIYMGLRQDQSFGREVSIKIATNAEEGVKAKLGQRLLELAKSDEKRRPSEPDEFIRFCNPHRHEVIAAKIPATMELDWNNPRFHLKVVSKLVSALYLRMEDLTDLKT